MENVKNQLESLKISDPLQFQNLTLFAIKGLNNYSLNYLTLSQAYEKNYVEHAKTCKVLKTCKNEIFEQIRPKLYATISSEHS